MRQQYHMPEKGQLWRHAATKIKYRVASVESGSWTGEAVAILKSGTRVYADDLNAEYNLCGQP